MRHTPRNTPVAPARRGFSLMEVLVALGIFALGFAAVAALLPAGALLQRRTADDIQSRHVERNAQSIIEQTQLTYDATIGDQGTELEFYYYGPDYGGEWPVNAARSELRPFNGASPHSLADFWSLDTRSFRSAIVDPIQRSVYWVPLIRDANGDETGPAWQIIVFVLDRDDNKTYTEADYSATTGRTYANWASEAPAGDGVDNDGDSTIDEADEIDGTERGVPSVRKFQLDTALTTGNTFVLDSTEYPIEGRLNDWIVDSNGRIYRITKINDAGTEITVNNTIPGTPDAVWFAPPPDDGDTTPSNTDISPAKRVFQINL